MRVILSDENNSSFEFAIRSSYDAYQVIDKNGRSFSLNVSEDYWNNFVNYINNSTGTFVISVYLNDNNECLEQSSNWYLDTVDLNDLLPGRYRGKVVTNILFKMKGE